jgi:hypothetical protein
MDSINAQVAKTIQKQLLNQCAGYSMQRWQKAIKTWPKIFMKRLKFADFELEAFSKKNLEINAWFVTESCTKMNIPYRMSHSLTAR